MADEGATGTENEQNGPAKGQEGASEASDLGDAGKKALDAERSRAKAAEQQLKTLRTELAVEKAKTFTDAERAIAQAKAEGRTEATVEAGKRLARAEIRAAGLEKGLDVAELLEDVDLARFVGEDGEPDQEAIAKRVERWAAMSNSTAPPARIRGDADQGHRGGRVPANPRDEFARLMRESALP